MHNNVVSYLKGRLPEYCSQKDNLEYQTHAFYLKSQSVMIEKKTIFKRIKVSKQNVDSLSHKTKKARNKIFFEIRIKKFQDICERLKAMVGGR